MKTIESFNFFAEAFDKREDFFTRLEEFQLKHGFIPYVYARNPAIMQSYREYLECGSWRKRKPVVKTIKRAARKATKNETHP